MIAKEKIKLLREAKKILKIGKPCKEPNMSCVVCRAYLAIAVIDDHIATLEWES